MNKSSITIIAALSAVLFSCTSDESEPVIIGPDCNVVEVTSDITEPTTWNTGTVYLISSDIDVENTLTIQAGAIIKVDAARIQVLGTGRIIANGTPSQNIIFTSVNDDSACGDSNADGSGTLPQKGDWDGLYLNGGENHIFNYCNFLYAGGDRGGFRNAVCTSVDGNSFTFDHCTFAHTLSGNSNGAFAFYGSYHMSDAAVSKFTNNIFYDNDRPLFVDSNYSLNPNNTFHNPSDATQKNSRNGIWLMDTAKNNVEVVWGETEVPYVLTSFNQGGLQNNLTIAADVIVKFDGETSGLLTQATRPVNLHAEAILTSYKDDGHGGDTNGDGDASTASEGDWDGYFNSDSNLYISAPNILFSAN